MTFEGREDDDTGSLLKGSAYKDGSTGLLLFGLEGVNLLGFCWSDLLKGFFLLLLLLVWD